MTRAPISIATILLVTFSVVADEPELPSKPPLSPVEARTKLDQKVVLRMLVREAKDRLEKHGEIYLDSELDFRSEKNFAVVITRDGAADLRSNNVPDPTSHFKGKTIQVEGVVKAVDKVPRIEISKAKQIKVVTIPTK